jgi:iron complex transport system ATP-binding protein
MASLSFEIDPIVPALDLMDATLMRGGNAVLRGIDLRIQPDEHTAILGPNGSGKTSLIKLITRERYPLLKPGAEPPIRIFGRSQWNVGELRSLMGIVTSDMHDAFVRAGAITAHEAVVSGFFGSVGLARHHVVAPWHVEYARVALEAVGAAHLAERTIETFSTGEARRVLIARALAPNPPALLLDEPTAGLDLAAMHYFLEQIRSVAASGVTLILVTHHIDEILPEIERVILLREGRIFRDGPKGETLTSANLTELYNVPVTVRPGSRAGYLRAEVG